MSRRAVLILFFVLMLTTPETTTIFGQGPSPQGSRRASTAVGTAFTFQGELERDGSSYSGVCDFQFGLWDDSGVSAQIGVTQTVSSLSVSAGLFTTPLDFGAGAFNGDKRWLAIGVRCPAGSGSYTALTPRQELTATPYAQYAKSSPWTGLAGIPAAFADGADNDTTYTAGDGLDLAGTQFKMKGTSYQNVVIVAASGGDYTSIQSALDSITDASSTNRYLVWIAPGVYTETVTMKQYVDIEGSGELTTKITYPGMGTWAIGTVNGASNAELRFLTVESTGGNLYAVAILNSAASPRLTHVTAIASGGTTDNRAVSSAGSTLIMTNVTATAAGGNNAYGMVNGTSSVTMTNVSAIASGGLNNNRGVFNTSSALMMTNVTAIGSGGTTASGLYNSGSSPTVQSSSLSASGGTNNYGIYNTASSGTHTVTVHNSQIGGSTNTIYNDSEFTTRIGASKLDGGPAGGGGVFACAGVYDENYTFYASTCP